MTYCRVSNRWHLWTIFFKTNSKVNHLRFAAVFCKLHKFETDFNDASASMFSVILLQTNMDLTHF